ncbi:MAG: sugar ABC transporter permease [Lachnospiraceae bacterium]|nr:sugar ABC transporter permease [Lachnospiraceae bacterium]
MEKVGKIFKEHTMQIILFLVVIFFAITTKGQILSAMNFEALITQNAYVFILATGMFMCMLIKGNIDLSVGATVCLIDAIGAYMMINMGISVPVAMIAMVIFGCIIGAVLGWLIAYLNIPPWIATLGGFLAFRGLGTKIVATASSTSSISVNDMKGFTNLFISHVPREFCIPIGIVCCVLFVILQVRARATKIKKGYEAESLADLVVRCVIICLIVMLFAIKYAGGIIDIKSLSNKKGIIAILLGKQTSLGLPAVLIWVAVVLLVYNFITGKTVLGRYFYAMGGNMEATRLSGIDTKLVLFFAYLNMQFLSVIAGWASLAKLSTANAFMGQNYELDAISACIVGGVSAYGGSGSVFGMVVGAALIGVINLGMSIMSIDPNWQKVIKGVVLLAAVVFEIVNNRPKTKA